MCGVTQRLLLGSWWDTDVLPARRSGHSLCPCAGAGPRSLLSLSHPFCSPAEAPAAPEVLSGPEGTSEPLMQCAAWLDAYFHKPTAIEGLPLPALHHPVFQKGWYPHLTR